jgi:peptidoglycan-associated lipoprotein
MQKCAKVSWIALIAVFVMACGSDPAPPPDTAGDVAPPPAPTTKNADNDGAGNADSDTSSGVGIDPRILKMCDLPEARFNFDSASVSGSARALLDAIAKCFTDGPGKGKGLNIVGHADPRGETEYNFALGQQRAGAIAGYLSKAGLSEGRIETSSRGELEATGSDDKGWSRDRRVEILLRD